MTWHEENVYWQKGNNDDRCDVDVEEKEEHKQIKRRRKTSENQQSEKYKNKKNKLNCQDEDKNKEGGRVTEVIKTEIKEYGSSRRVSAWNKRMVKRTLKRRWRKEGMG